jgi:mRNA interferase MazF
VAPQGAHGKPQGKPRPDLVIQSDLFAEHPSVTMLPVTSEPRPTPLFRIRIEPTPENGLHVPCQVMVDKALSVPRKEIGPAFGRLDAEGMLAVNRALAVFLGFA